MTRAGAVAWPVLACSFLAALGAPAPARAQAAGDAARGRALFAAKECARCHRPHGEPGAGPALEEVRRPQGGFELAGRLWNHAPAMFRAVRGKGLEWPELSPAEVEDLMAYLQADPARDPRPDLARGEALLVRKGCLKCHRLRGEGGRVGPDLAERRASYDSAAAWAARMWVHTPRMADKARELGVLYPRFADDEMDNLVGFLRSAAK
jgi:cytochrome c551/c552